MESETTEAIPLSILYLQIEYGDNPSAVLGIGSNASDLEIREAYRAVALKIHPDKAPSENIREVHTLLFQKVQTAYDSLLETQEDSEAGRLSRPKQLPETLTSLHTRNVAFREALRGAREKAVQAKHVADALKASKEANKKAKNERLAEKRELRSHVLREEQAKRQIEIMKERRGNVICSGSLVEDVKCSEEVKACCTSLLD
jgi:curved DNA-binding protein CbpA